MVKKVINPLTGKKINVGGPTYTALVAQGHIVGSRTSGKLTLSPPMVVAAKALMAKKKGKNPYLAYKAKLASKKSLPKGKSSGWLAAIKSPGGVVGAALAMPLPPTPIVTPTTFALPTTPAPQLPGAFPVAPSSRQPILFYDKKKPYYEFTNFYTPAKFKADGQTWASSEHYFQAHKFENTPKLYKLFTGGSTALKPMMAFNLARQYSAYKDPDWDIKKDSVMKRALIEKFKQNKALGAKLDKTGTAPLIEASPVDAYWGYGPNKNGQNKLGLMLMQLRSERAAGLHK
jgi:ribA/ribD-fused uncharacterized protein